MRGRGTAALPQKSYFCKILYLPTVLTPEATAILNLLCGVYQLLAKVLYGSGLRLSEGLNLRVKDLDFTQRQIVVRDTKGRESRITMLPASLVTPLSGHLQWVKQIHQQDLQQGYGSVYLPYALERKYPNAEREWIWQYVFLAPSRSWRSRAVTFAIHEFIIKQIAKTGPSSR